MSGSLPQMVWAAPRMRRSTILAPAGLERLRSATETFTLTADGSDEPSLAGSAWVVAAKPRKATAAKAAKLVLANMLYFLQGGAGCAAVRPKRRPIGPR